MCGICGVFNLKNNTILDLEEFGKDLLELPKEPSPYFVFFNFLTVHDPYIPLIETFKNFSITINDFKQIKATVIIKEVVRIVHDTIYYTDTIPCDFNPIKLAKNTQNYAFRATFAKEYFTIDSLFIDRPFTNYVGLFGYTKGSSLDSIAVTNIDIRGDQYVGGLIGLTRNSEIANSYSTGTVTGYNNVGGLVGNNTATGIASSFNTGSVNGHDRVGGIVGTQYLNGPQNCYNTGSVTGK